jgi:hypothetical protein
MPVGIKLSRDAGYEANGQHDQRHNNKQGIAPVTSIGGSACGVFVADAFE